MPDDRGLPQLIAKSVDLLAVVERLASEPLLGFDTEGASFHRYADRVFLIQVSSRTLSVVVDPLAVDDLEPLGRLLADPGIEVVFHDADFDLRSLDRDYRFRARRIFDTRIAAQLLGEPGIGLGAMLEKHFGVRLNKKFQRADWSQRPLSPEMLAYAAADTTHLPPLRDRLAAELRQRGREAWAGEEFARLESLRWNPAEDGAPYLRLKGARALPPAALAVLRALYTWRDSEARSRDRATFRIVANEALVGLARLAPTDLAGLPRVPELPASVARRYGGALLAAIREGRAAPERDWPRFERRSGSRPDPETEARLERLKQARNERAKELGIEPGVLCPNGTLELMARLPEAGEAQLAMIPDLRAWQLQAFGADRLRAAWPQPGGPGAGNGG